jgi:hypothetical protein
VLLALDFLHCQGVLHRGEQPFAGCCAHPDGVTLKAPDRLQTSSQTTS